MKKHKRKQRRQFYVKASEKLLAVVSANKFKFMLYDVVGCDKAIMFGNQEVIDAYNKAWDALSNLHVAATKQYVATEEGKRWKNRVSG